MNEVTLERVAGSEFSTPVSPGVLGRLGVTNSKDREQNTPCGPCSPTPQDGDGSMYYVLTVEERVIRRCMVKIGDADLAEYPGYGKGGGLSTPEDQEELAAELAFELAVSNIDGADEHDERVVATKEYANFTDQSFQGPYSSKEQAAEEYPWAFRN